MAIVAFDGPIERMLEYMRDIAEESDWSPVELGEPPSKKLASLEIDHCEVGVGGEQILRTRYEVDAPLEECLRLSRPEVLFHGQRSEILPDIVECGVHEVFAPGYAATWMRVRLLAEAPRMSALVAAVSGKCGDLQYVQRYAESDKDGAVVTVCWYVMTKRDFPTPGQHALVMMPRHPETGELLQVWGVTRASVYFLRPSPDLAKTLITSFKPQPEMPSWTLPTAAAKITTLGQTMHQHCMERTVNFHGSHAFRAMALAQVGYTVLCLRKCTRGGPLLPLDCDGGRVSSGGKWEQVDGRTMPLKGYLREFLSRLGVHEAAIYDTLDGARLVPYQAVVRVDIWGRLLSLLDGPFREQRGAYRRLNGGKNAPELRADAEPRFRIPGLGGESDVDGSSDCGSTATSRMSVNSREDLSSSSDGGGVPVRGTFIHFHEQPSLIRRCGSFPIMESAKEISAF